MYCPRVGAGGGRERVLRMEGGQEAIKQRQALYKPRGVCCEPRRMHDSVLLRAFREGRGSGWSGKIQRLFKGEVGGEWVMGKVISA